MFYAQDENPFTLAEQHCALTLVEKLNKQKIFRTKMCPIPSSPQGGVGDQMGGIGHIQDSTRVLN